MHITPTTWNYRHQVHKDLVFFLSCERNEITNSAEYNFYGVGQKEARTMALTELVALHRFLGEAIAAEKETPT